MRGLKYEITAPHRTAPLLLLLTSVLAACGSQTVKTDADASTGSNGLVYYNETSVSINPGILSLERQVEALGLKQHGQNVNTLMRTEKGDVEFFRKELIVKVDNQKAFGKFLKKYNGVVLNDGIMPTPKLVGEEKGNKLRSVPQGIWQLVQIDAPDIPLENVVKKLNKMQLKGNIQFPDQETANVYYASLDARDEFGLSTETNYVMRPTASGSDQENFLNGSRLTPNTPGFNWQLKNTGVIAAWVVAQSKMLPCRLPSP